MKILKIIEWSLGFILLLMILVGMYLLVLDLVVDFYKGTEFTVLFKKTLKDFLLIIIAFDLALILFTHNIEYLLDLLAFIVVRKIIAIELIDPVALLLDIVALAGIFGIRKFLLLRKI